MAMALELDGLGLLLDVGLLRDPTGSTLGPCFSFALFAVLPAYEADLYGTKYIGAIHGRLVDFIFPSDCFQNIVLADF